MLGEKIKPIQNYNSSMDSAIGCALKSYTFYYTGQIELFWDRFTFSTKHKIFYNSNDDF
jgi:hypothetical protein